MAGIAGIEQAVATSVDDLDQVACAGKIGQRLAAAGRGGGVRAAACVPRGSAVAGAYDGRPGFDDHGPCMVDQAVEMRLAVLSTCSSSRASFNELGRWQGWRWLASMVVRGGQGSGGRWPA
ncbi:hypothetical protein ACLOJK_022308 [Asimina triloba]